MLLTINTRSCNGNLCWQRGLNICQSENFRNEWHQSIILFICIPVNFLAPSHDLWPQAESCTVWLCLNEKTRRNHQQVQSSWPSHEVRFDVICIYFGRRSKSCTYWSRLHMQVTKNQGDCSWIIRISHQDKTEKRTTLFSSLLICLGMVLEAGNFCSPLSLSLYIQYS